MSLASTLTLEDLYALYAPKASRFPQSMTAQDLHDMFESKAQADNIKDSMTLHDFAKFIDSRRSSASASTPAPAMMEEPSSSEDDEEVILTPKMAPASTALAPIDDVMLCSPYKRDRRIISGFYRDEDEEQQLPELSALKPEIAKRLKATPEPALAAAVVESVEENTAITKPHNGAVKKPSTGLELLAALVQSLPPLPPPTVTMAIASTDSDSEAPPMNLRMRMPKVVHPRIPSPVRTAKDVLKPYSLTRVAIARLLQSLPKAFPKQAKALGKLALDDLTGESDLEVVWTDGVGRLKGFEHDEFVRGPVTQVFVDHSNILFAHIHHLETHSKGFIPTKQQRTLSLPALSLLLQRGRLSPRGSLHLVGSSPLRDRPDLDRLIRLGWECSVLKRVSSGSDVKRFREQGVDELLQLKMLQALNAYPPPAFDGATIVLATGDAQSGQFNRDGFVGVVREALRRGWNVELWSYKSGLSRAWKETAKAEGWTRFSIRLLDEFAEDLVEIGDGVMTDE